MPQYPLPTGDVPIDGGDLPVSSSVDVLKAFPRMFRNAATAPVRDGLVAAITAMLTYYQSRASFAAAQSDVLRAEGDALKAFGAAVGVFQQQGESTEAYRLRIIGIPNLVTPAAILAAAGAILAPFTPILPRYCESIQDRWFINRRTENGSTWHSYVWRKAFTSRAPTYLDRLYPGDAAANGGFFRPQSEPGGARVFRDHLGRLFVLRVPDITRIDRAGAFVRKRTSYAQNPLIQPGLKRGFFLRRDGSTQPVTNGSFPRRDATTAQAVYDAITNTINTIKGHGVRWVFVADPKLIS